jgi:hypothetical protein
MKGRGGEKRRVQRSTREQSLAEQSWVYIRFVRSNAWDNGFASFPSNDGWFFSVSRQWFRLHPFFNAWV